MRGTRKRPSWAAGAAARASAAGRDGRATSGRNTFVSGTAWLVGGMSAAATSATRATADRIASSCGASASSSSSVTDIRDSRARWATSSRVIPMACGPFVGGGPGGPRLVVRGAGGRAPGRAADSVTDGPGRPGDAPRRRDVIVRAARRPGPSAARRAERGAAAEPPAAAGMPIDTGPVGGAAPSPPTAGQVCFSVRSQVAAALRHLGVTAQPCSGHTLCACSATCRT
ncbi:hypothetical protein FAGKG844_120122 [Frankia sp. AgKG'84/4]